MNYTPTHQVTFRRGMGKIYYENLLNIRCPFDLKTGDKHFSICKKLISPILLSLVIAWTGTATFRKLLISFPCPVININVFFYGDITLVRNNVLLHSHTESDHARSTKTDRQKSLHNALERSSHNNSKTTTALFCVIFGDEFHYTELETRVWRLNLGYFLRHHWDRRECV